jgi:hypothetical protein
MAAARIRYARGFISNAGINLACRWTIIEDTFLKLELRRQTDVSHLVSRLERLEDARETDRETKRKADREWERDREREWEREWEAHCTNGS